jgi:hypothetical protein
MRTSLPHCVAIMWLSFAWGAVAQAQTLSIRGFADTGVTMFTASRSFDAVLGSRTGPVFGGGVEVVLPSRIFVNVRASRFRKEGERVFVFEGETFPLGIPAVVTITPAELTGGYLFRRLRRNVRGVTTPSRLTPFVGGGIGWHRYAEESEGAAAGENVDTVHRGYHVLGGAEFRMTRWLGVAAEAQWTTVPDALGTDPNSVSAAFDETDLGGATVRVRLIIGR